MDELSSGSSERVDYYGTRSGRRRPGSPGAENTEYAEVDFLSQLPDEVISHILSFMSLENAVKAKLLSRRWKCLYPTNPTVSFRASEQDWNESLSEYVARVDKIMQQFRAPKIKCFEVVLGGQYRNWSYYANRVDEWILLACLMKTERIHLSFGGSMDDGAYKFPFHILSTGESSILKHLELFECSLQPFSSLAGPLIRLRTLKLTFVSFTSNCDDLATYFPNLENLALSHCKQVPEMQDLFDLCGRLSHLKSLKVVRCDGLGDFRCHI